MSEPQPKDKQIWCEADNHALFHNYPDFNEWIESESGEHSRFELGIDGLTEPSKALYASDRSRYQLLFQNYRADRRADGLSKDYFDDHWYQRNHDRFEQLLGRLQEGTVVPFVGAGMSVDSGFPTWKNHLREQGKTAGVTTSDIEGLLDVGRYEEVVELIENTRGRAVFINEIRDVFSRDSMPSDAMLLLRDLASDTFITTNYDRMIEKGFELGDGYQYEVIEANDASAPPAPDKTTVYKLHGDALNPGGCILAKSQYDDAYGTLHTNLDRPLPRLLEYHYRSSNLLFLGSSLNEDRTVEVFRAVRESMGETAAPLHFSIEQAPEDDAELPNRNAYLADLGISAIWIEGERFDLVEEILRLARNELRYRGLL